MAFSNSSKTHPPYAFKSDGTVHYREGVDGSEIYIRQGQRDNVESLKTLPARSVRYAQRSDGTETYPRKEVRFANEDTGEEETAVVEDYLPQVGYARKRNALTNLPPESYYPLGLNGHEYYFRVQNGSPGAPPNDYPVNKDGFYLIPVKSGRQQQQQQQTESDGSRRQRIVKYISIPTAPKASEIMNVRNKSSLPKDLVLPGIHYYRTAVRAEREPRVLIPYGNESRTIDVSMPPVPRANSEEDDRTDTEPEEDEEKRSSCDSNDENCVANDEDEDRGTKKNDPNDDGTDTDTDDSVEESDLQTRPSLSGVTNVFGSFYVWITIVVACLSIAISIIMKKYKLI